MSVPLVLGCLWVLAAAVTAMLPVRGQCAPGLVLLGAAPFLIGWTGATHGWLPAALCCGVLISVFRHPLAHLIRRVYRPFAGRPEQDLQSHPEVPS